MYVCMYVYCKRLRLFLESVEFRFDDVEVEFEVSICC
jgi:hypothetical protein